MIDNEVEEVVDETLEEEEVVKKPGMFFENEFSIIQDESELPMDENEPEIEEGPSIEEQIAEAVKAATNTKDVEMINTLKGIQEAVKPKKEAPKQVNLEEEIEKISTQLTEDPKLAVKGLNNLITQQVAQALQIQQGQIVEGQKVTSKMLAQNDPNLKIVFENWENEVEEEVKKTTIRPGVAVNDIYREAGNKVMLAHLGDVVTMKAQELLKTKPSAKPVKSGIKDSHEAPVQEGKVSHPVYKIPAGTKFRGMDATQWVKSQPNQTRALAYLESKGIAKKIK